MQVLPESFLESVTQLAPGERAPYARASNLYGGGGGGGEGGGREKEEMMEGEGNKEAEVAFVFTDVQSSTKLWEKVPEAMNVGRFYMY